ncbi:hypothetical protein FRC06_005981 [Ceratobasidium sp. 370]|nr:hypothetical protein FRC06_005981 [Ceratobasidium sp. 370]
MPNRAHSALPALLSIAAYLTIPKEYTESASQLAVCRPFALIICAGTSSIHRQLRSLRASPPVVFALMSSNEIPAAIATHVPPLVQAAATSHFMRCRPLPVLARLQPGVFAIDGTRSDDRRTSNGVNCARLAFVICCPPLHLSLFGKQISSAQIM